MGSSTAIITAGFADVGVQALLILGGMVTLALTIYLVRWGLGKIKISMTNGGLKVYKPFDSWSEAEYTKAWLALTPEKRENYYGDMDMWIERGLD